MSHSPSVMNSLKTAALIERNPGAVSSTCVAYGWLYIKAVHVQTYLEQRALLQQAREISDFIAVDGAGVVALNLPPRLSEAYNSVKSGYRYAVRDEGGRIVATSGRGIGPITLLMGERAGARRTYEEGTATAA